MIIKSSLLKEHIMTSISFHDLRYSFIEPIPGKRDGIFWGFMNYVHVLLQIFFYVPVISHKKFHPLIIDTNWTLMNPSDGHIMDGMKFNT